MGFFSKKRTIFGSKTKKIAAIFCNRGIQTVRSQTFPTSNQKTEAHTEEKRSRRICCYDRGLKFEASLETRVYVSCPPVRQCTELADDSKSSELADWAELQRCNLQGVCTFLLPLALSLELLYFSPLFTLSLRGHRNIWLQTIIFPSDWDSFWDLRNLSLRLSVYLLCYFVLFSSTILLTPPLNFPQKKISRQSWRKFVPGYGSLVREIFHK